MKRIWAIAGVVWRDWMRRKDIYVLLVLLAALLLLLTSVNVFGLRGTARYALDIGLLLTWGCAWFLAINAGTRELPREEAGGTIFLLLSKPLRRGELVLGKWLGVWSSVGAATLLFYLATWAVVALQGVAVAPAVLLQALALHLAALGILVALALLCSTRLNRDAAAVLAGVASAVSLLLVPQLPQLAGHGGSLRAAAMQVLYYALPHLEVFDLRRRLVHEYPPIDALTLMTALLYGVIVTALLLLLAWLAYRHKSFARDRLTH